VALFEFMASTPRVRQCLVRGDDVGMILAETIENGVSEGMQPFKMQWESLRRSRTIEPETVLTPPLADRPEIADPLAVAGYAKDLPVILPRHMGNRLTHWPRN
jgi:hypothetical protein